MLTSMLRSFVKVGALTLVDPKGRVTQIEGAVDGPHVRVRITDPKLMYSLFFNPEMKAGEAYMDGTLVMEEGTVGDLLLLFALNRENLRSTPVQKALRGTLKKLKRLQQFNTLKNSRRNVAHHYDISNDLYRLFLDDDMHYSCAYFTEDGQDLNTAQQNKLKHIAAKMDLKAGMKVLDIGCGWGGMAMFLAENFDVTVHGVTLSTEQQALATERAWDRGLQDKVSFELKDYRHLTGSYDRIVSIGMFEHVGASRYDAFFPKVKSLLADDGVMLLHSIGRMGEPGATAGWLRKYIFPGSYAPAVSETMAAVERAGLYMTDTEILRIHYADTLKHWHENFQKNRAEVEAMFDERFCRMFEFYFLMCEMGFRYGKQMVFQIQLTKSLDTLPITRDYMRDVEAHIR